MVGGPALSGQRRVTPDEAAELLDVPASLIASWKHRKRVTPLAFIYRAEGHGGRKVPVYSLEELEPLAEQWKARRDTRQFRAKPSTATSSDVI